MFRLACLFCAATSTTAFAPVEPRPAFTTTLYSSSYRVNYVVPDTINMEEQRQALLNQFNALHQKSNNGQVVEAAAAPQEPAPVVEKTTPPPPPPPTATAQPAVAAEQQSPPIASSSASIEPMAHIPAPIERMAPPVFVPPPQEPVLGQVTSRPPAVGAMPVKATVVAPVAEPVIPKVTATPSTTTTSPRAVFVPPPQEPVLGQVTPSRVTPVLPSTDAAPPAVVAPKPVMSEVTTSTPPQTLFEQRNQHIIEADAAGKGRWGKAEVQRAASVQDNVLDPPAVSAPPDMAVSQIFEQRNQQIVEAAAAGKGRWGKLEVEKAKYDLSLKQAMATLNALLAQPPSDTQDGLDDEVMPVTQDALDQAMATAIEASLVDQRNQQIIAAAGAGKGRWGKSEVEKAKFDLGLKQAMATLTGSKLSGLRTQFPTDKQDGLDEPMATTMSDIIQQRNLQIVKAAAAGKGRWGRLEVERISSSSSSASLKTILDTPKVPSMSTSDIFNQRNQQIIEAAATGKGRWGTAEVEKAKAALGLKQDSLDEPMLVTQFLQDGLAVTQSQHGQQGSLEKPKVPSMSTSDIFDRRNQQIIEAAGAGKGRWGVAEVEKAKAAVGLKYEPMLVTQFLNGKQGSLKEPMPVAQSPNGQQDTFADPAAAMVTSLFDQRNQQILEAAAAGKGRWGKLEVEKAKNDLGLKRAMATLSALSTHV